jgi:hypothetical protein
MENLFTDSSSTREILSDYLFVEEQIGSISQGTFTSRYFVSFPFCGLKWFAQKKYNLNYAQSLYDIININDQNNEEGWIYGGNIIISYLKCEDSISSKDIISTSISTSILDNFNSEINVGESLYPFIIKIQRGDDIEMSIRLAATSYEQQQKWINNINAMKDNQRFIQSCCSFNSLPSRRLFNSSNIHELNTFHSDCIDISIATLYSINSYLKLLYPLKSVLHALILKNSQLSDDHIEPLSQLLLNNNTLKVFSVSENFISCKGIIGLSTALNNCTQMNELDFSSNCISDVGAEVITKIILSLPHLEKLNLSKNLITNKSSRPMINTLGRYCSKITHINMSYNRIGDGVASLVTLLMFNKPSLITHCDLSFCNISDRGVQDLSEAITSCESINFINLQGSFVNADTLIKLTTILSEHAKSNLRKNQVNNLSVEIGGILLDKMENQSLISLSHNSIKSSLPFVDDEFLLRKIVLHRRQHQQKGLIINNSNSKKSFAASAEASVSNPIVKGMTVCMQLQLPKRIKSIQEIIRLLSNSLGISFRRFKLLSFTPTNEDVNETMKSNLSVVFLIKDQTASSSLNINTNKIFSYKVASRMSLQKQQQILSNNDTKKLDISNVEIIKKLKKFAEESSPIFRLIGLRSIYVQDKSLNLNIRISLSNIGGRGLEDDFVDSLSPNSYIQDSSDNLFEDINDDEVINVNNSFNKISDLIDNLKIDERLENVSKENKRSDPISKSITNRKSKIINERFSHSVRQLKLSDSINNATAKFWEGAFGNARYKKYMNKILDTCLNNEGVYKAVGFRQSLCDSMFRRDSKHLQDTLKDLKENQMDGHHALIFSERIVSDILCIQNDSKNLELLTNSFDDLCIVEKFLVNCAESSYSGPEMYKAIEIRQNIIITAIEEEPEKYRELLPIIQQKAYLSNVLLSRDFDKLKSTINCLPENIVPSLQELVSISKKLIFVQKIVNDDLQKAILDRNLLNLEEIIAVASYHNIYNDLVQIGYNLIIELSISPINLLAPIVNAVKENNMKLFNEGLLVARRNGLKHLDIDATIAQNIIDSNEKLIQEDLIKNNLTKVALSIKNGTNVSCGEIMQLLRRSKLMNLVKDPSYKVYINILEKQRRKFSWLAKQEDQIQDQIDNNDIENLEVLLAGRGKGRLVINAPTYDLLCEWMKHLEDVCNGRFDNNNPIHDIYNLNPDHLIMAGTMEKAARSDGVLRGWRQRYFSLHSNSLTYYTKLDGVQKGFIRVLGGAIRQLSVAESGGRPFCIELQEGRDLSIYNPDLLDDARKQVRAVRSLELSNSIRMCIDINDRYNLAKLLDSVQTKGIYLDLNLLSEARNVIDKDNIKKLKYDLRKSLITIPRGLIGELLRKASLFNLDPKISLLSQAKRLLEITDIEQNILRIRGSIESNNENNFFQGFAHLARLESKQLNLRDHRLLVAILLQNTGKRALYSRYLGVPKSVITRSMKYSLSCIQQFNLETEPIQLSRLAISLMSIVHSSKDSNINTNMDIQLDKSLKFSKYLDEKISLIELNPEYAIESYSALNSPFVLKDTFLSSLRGEGKIAFQEFLSYVSYPISKSLLKLPKSDQQLCIDAFSALMIVLNHNNSSVITKKNLIANRNDDIITIAYKIIKSGQSQLNNDNYRDELYLQLCKQLTNNPEIINSIRGWLLMSLYLHAFNPSSTLMPFIRNFVTKYLKTSEVNVSIAKKSLEEIKSNVNKEQHEDTSLIILIETAEKKIKDSKKLYQIVYYCEWLSSNKIIKQKVEKNDEDSTVMSNSLNENDSTINDSRDDDEFEDISINIIDNVFNQNSVEFKITTMSGSIYSMDCKYGEISTPHSLLPLIYNRITSGCEEDVTDKNILYRIFRGFSFYKKDNMDSDDNNINSISIQPNENKLLDWNFDLIWELLLLKLTLNDTSCSNNTVDETTLNDQSIEDSTITDAIIDDDLVMVNKINTDIQHLILRRRVAMKSERFIDQLDLFDDHISDVDILGIKKLWSNFLLSESLPSDYVRIDLLFAEESRYVNSGLYAGSDYMQMYLLAIQIALSYSTTNDKSIWNNGNNDGDILSNVNYSVYSTNQSLNRKKNNIEETKAESFSIQTEVNEESNELVPSVSSEEEENDDDDDDDEISVVSSDTNMSDSIVDDNISEESSEEDVDEFPKVIKIVTIEERLESLGLNHVVQDFNLLSMIKELVPQFLEISKDISSDSPQIRYLLKRAYLYYLMSWPLFGNRYFEAKLSDNYISKTQTVLISLSTCGILILDPNGFCVIFECKLDDVDLFNVSHDNKNKKILLIKINGYELKLKCESSYELINIVEAFSLEVLGHGSYQLGSEGCSDPFDLGPEPPMKSDSKEILQQYYRDFPNLPNSPAISTLHQSEDYFEAPMSERDLLAEARLEEERIEIEQSRLAAAVQVERQQAMMEQGRKNVMQFDNNNDDDDDDDDDEIENEKQSKNKKRVSKRRNRSTIGASLVSPTEMLEQRISSGAAGVSGRKSTRVILPPPIIRSKLLKIHNLERREVANNPDLSLIDLPNPNNLSPVSLKWQSKF